LLGEELTDGEGKEGEGRPLKRQRKDDGKEETPTSVADMDHDEHEGMDEASLKEHEQVTKVKNVEKVELGDFLMETWYFSPYPKELFPENRSTIETLYVCEYTFNFFAHKSELLR